MGPGKERVLETWQGIQNIRQGLFKKAEPRWSLWYTGLKTWQKHKLIGVGTGGYPVSAESIKLEQPELTFGPGASSKPAHPHNMYLLALSRWGPTGVATMLFLLVMWARTGWKLNWQQTDAGSLITLPALAMAIHGLSSSSLEEHFSDIIAVFLLTAGFALLRSRTSSYPSGMPNGA
jgi:O-antigen ligase